MNDNLRLELSNDDKNFSGVVYDMITGAFDTETETTVAPPQANAIRKYEYAYGNASGQFKAYYAPIYLTIGRSALTLTEGTHTFSFNIPNIKNVLPKNVQYSDDMILRLHSGYTFYVSTPNGTRTLYEMYPRTSSSFQINSIELIPNVDVSHNEIQLIVNYTVGADYASRYSETYIKLMFFVVLHKKLS